jgi:hypothetical protein
MVSIVCLLIGLNFFLFLSFFLLCVCVCVRTGNLFNGVIKGLGRGGAARNCTDRSVSHRPTTGHRRAMQDHWG